MPSSSTRGRSSWLYRRSNAFPAGLFEISLRDNLRNTRRISALTEHFYQGPPMRACPLRKGQRIGAFETTGDQAAEPAKVLLESVRRFKGLERPVIVLTGIDDLPAADETALLYCGLSRARVHLVIVATEATLERVAGGRER